MNRNSKGFTLVEIMIVVCIIGMLSAVAIPSARNARLQAQAVGVANDMRVFGNAFAQYSIERGQYPVRPPWPYLGVLPAGVPEYLKTPQDFANGPACTGDYVWYGKWGGSPLVTLEIWNIDPGNGEQLLMIDKQMDDGNPWNGRVRLVNWPNCDELWYYLEK